MIGEPVWPQGGAGGKSAVYVSAQSLHFLCDRPVLGRTATCGAGRPEIWRSLVSAFFFV